MDRRLKLWFIPPLELVPGSISASPTVWPVLHKRLQYQFGQRTGAGGLVHRQGKLKRPGVAGLHDAQVAAGDIRRMAAGTYDVRVPVCTEDELGVLAGELNAMADNTRQLLLRIREESEQRHRFELSYLQVQMQPHFLYNTLETVCGMIQSGESEESIELINQISGFYRAVLNV